MSSKAPRSYAEQLISLSSHGDRGRAGGSPALKVTELLPRARKLRLHHRELPLMLHLQKRARPNAAQIEIRRSSD